MASVFYGWLPLDAKAVLLLKNLGAAFGAKSLRRHPYYVTLSEDVVPV